MKNKENKILIVSSSLDNGGAQKMISNITTNLPEEWEADILLNSSENIQFPYKGNIISLNIPEPKSRTSLIYQAVVLLKRLKMLYKLKKKNHYKACISFLDSANVANILTGNHYCKVIINIVINMTVATKNEPINVWIINPLTRLLYNKADKIVALSNEVREDMIENFGIIPQKITSIYCSIDTHDINEKVSRPLEEDVKEWFSKDRTIVTAGRLEKQKGQWHLIRAFSKVVKAVPDAKLVIFGNGALKDDLEKLIIDYHLERNVYLFGFSSNLNNYIAHSAVFAFPSIYEGFGTALQEALACNVPCVAADYISGAREQLAPTLKGEISGYVKAEFGIVTERFSAKMNSAEVALDSAENSMADALIELLQSKELRESYALKAKERSAIYDVKNICNQWVKVIES